MSIFCKNYYSSNDHISETTEPNFMAKHILERGMLGLSFDVLEIWGGHIEFHRHIEFNQKNAFFTVMATTDFKSEVTIRKLRKNYIRFM